jgi:hypothetical protein
MQTRDVLLIFALMLYQAAQAAQPFFPLTKDGHEWEATFCGFIADRNVSVSASGLFARYGKRVGRIPLERTEYLQWLWTRSISKDVLVAYESTDPSADGSSGGLCRLSSDLTKRRWCLQFPAFNVVASVSNRGTVFLAGIGTLAEVDPSSGNYLWKVEGLYDQSPAFNVFRTPIEQNAHYVEFYADSGLRNTSIWRAVVDRRAGRLISVSGASDYPVGAQEIQRATDVCLR